MTSSGSVASNMAGNFNRLLVTSVAVSTAVVQLMSNVKKIVPRRRKAASEEE